MRYAEYHKKMARLDRGIADCLQRETKAMTGEGPWYVRMFPSLRESAIKAANRKRGKLIGERNTLDAGMFASSLVWNTPVVGLFRSAAPASPEAMASLCEAADAAFDLANERGR